jgi:hypothetical protein
MGRGVNGNSDSSPVTPRRSGAGMMFGGGSRRRVTILDAPQNPVYARDEQAAAFDPDTADWLQLFVDGKLDSPLPKITAAVKTLSRNTMVIAASGGLEAPPSMKAYQGFIGIRFTDGTQTKAEFVGMLIHGPAHAPYKQGGVKYAGPMLRTAMVEVNTMLGKKMKGRASSAIYNPVNPGAPVQLDDVGVRKALISALKK